MRPAAAEKKQKIEWLVKDNLQSKEEQDSYQIF